MKLLLDTHAVLWWFVGSLSLSPAAREAIDLPQSEVYVSAASGWEIATKFRLGKLPVPSEVVVDLEKMVETEGFRRLSVTFHHGHLAGTLAIPHKDPFDRMLIAQSISEDLTLISNESLFDSYGVTRLW